MNKQKKAESAEKLLTLRPTVRYTLERGGFYGWLYKSNPDYYPGKVILILGGSDGYFSQAKYIAEQFVKRGINALALGYWKQEGLPQEFCEVPLDTIEKAAERMRMLGMKQIGIWGISMGALAGLHIASLRPDLFSMVVSVSGIDFTPQAFAEGKKGLPETSAFSYHGRPLPWEPLTYDRKQIAWDSLKQRQPVMTSCYSGKTDQLINPKSLIPVERISGPILCISAKNDSFWPSAECSARMMHHLDDAGFAYDHRLVVYEYGTHLMTPVKLQSDAYYANSRKSPEEMERARADAMAKVFERIARW